MQGIANNVLNPTAQDVMIHPKEVLKQVDEQSIVGMVVT